MSMRDYMMRFCAGILVVALLMIFLRWFTVVVLIEGCKWDNALTQLVLWDNWRLPERIHPREKDIDWAGLYPFLEPQPERSLLTEIRQQENKIREEQARIASWSETYFPGYTNIVETGRRYDQLIGWNIRPLTRVDDHAVSPPFLSPVVPAMQDPFYHLLFMGLGFL